jgi:hypothetical protein
MAKQLSDMAIEAILNDIDLSAKVAKILGLKKITGLDATLKRNGPKVNKYENIQAIAAAMLVEPEWILEDKEEEKEIAKAV